MNAPQVIVEIGQAHDGSIGILHSLVDAIADTGARVVKFQMHIAEAESSVHDEFRVKFSRVDATRFDYWRRMELSPTLWRELKAHCEARGCEFLCTPFSVAAVELLNAMDVSRFKVGSGDIGNLVLLEAIARTGKPVMLSSGMSDFEELDVAVDLLKLRGVEVAVMQCTSEYPVPPSRWGLNVISELRARYDVPVGLSDHSGTIYPGLAAAAIGAELIEVHATFDRRMFGPDATSSLTIDELQVLVDGVRQIGEALATPIVKSEVTKLERMRHLFGRSITVCRDMAAGEKLALEDLEAAKPASFGIPPSEYLKVVGRRLRRALPKWSFVREEDLE